MAWLFQEIIGYLSDPAFLAILILGGYIFQKYRKRQEEKFYEAMCRRERITRRLMES